MIVAWEKKEVEYNFPAPSLQEQRRCSWAYSQAISFLSSQLQIKLCLGPTNLPSSWPFRPGYANGNLLLSTPEGFPIPWKVLNLAQASVNSAFFKLSPVTPLDWNNQLLSPRTLIHTEMYYSCTSFFGPP